MTAKKNFRSLPYEELIAFTSTLSTQDPDNFTADDYADIAVWIASDGCTMVPDLYLVACIEHDFYYATARDFYGNLISRAEADKRLRKRIQKMSRLKKFSPWSYLVYTGVTMFGWMFW